MALVLFFSASDTSLEDTQTSYTERLREKSRSISMNGNNDKHTHFTRSSSKDVLNDSHLRANTELNRIECSLTNENLSRSKSIGQQTQAIPTMFKQQTYISDSDFQSKRNFFENRLYTDNALTNSLISINPLPTKPKTYTLSPSNTQMIHNGSLSQQTTMNNTPQRNITRYESSLHV